MNNKYTQENLFRAISDSKSWADVCRRFGVNPCTGAQTHIKKRAVFFGLDFSHFTGRAHNKGKSWVLVNVKDCLFNGSAINSHRLKERLFRDGLKEKKCENCETTQWMGEECVFELDHINNSPHDNRLENLKILCPNCHRLKTRKERAAR